MDKIVRFNILGRVTTSWTYSIHLLKDVTFLFDKGKRKKFDPDVSEYMQHVLQELDDGKYYELLQSDHFIKVRFFFIIYENYSVVSRQLIFETDRFQCLN